MEDHCGRELEWGRNPYPFQGIANQGYFPLLPNDFVFDTLLHSLALTICLLHIHPSAVVPKGLPWKARREEGAGETEETLCIPVM